MRGLWFRLAGQAFLEGGIWAASDAGGFEEEGQSRNLVVEGTMRGRRDVYCRSCRSYWRRGEAKFWVVDILALQAGAWEVEVCFDMRLEMV